MYQAIRNLFFRWKTDLFREPGEPGRRQLLAPGRWYYVLMLLLAGFLFYYGLFDARFIPNPLIIAMGAGVLLSALAELLPKERTTLAGLLRAGSNLALISMFVIVVVLILTDT